MFKITADVNSRQFSEQHKQSFVQYMKKIGDELKKQFKQMNIELHYVRRDDNVQMIFAIDYNNPEKIYSYFGKWSEMQWSMYET